MKKCYIIILLLIGFNCKEVVEYLNDLKQLSPNLTEIVSHSIYKIIKDMTSNCLENESMCLIKLKNGLDMINKISNISYDGVFLSNLESIIMKNNQQTTNTYVQLSKSILSKFPETINIKPLTNICKSICPKIELKICELCLTEGIKGFRSLLFFGLIKKEDVCIFLMRLIGAKEKHCYN